MTFQRASGILLHPTCLPSQFGIGDLGQPAYAFVDFLERSGQKLWQILPLGPTGYEHSPYIMNFSTFAGNPLMISLEQLAEDGLLNSEELTPLPSDADSRYARVDFAQVIPHKYGLLKTAFDRFQQLPSSPDYETFCQEQSWWLDDFVLFMALLEAHDYKPWNQWEPALARREPAALQAHAEALQEQVTFHRFLQFTFFKQWAKLRAYANQKAIQIVGDVSIYVCHNSADVWAAPDMFKLDPDTFDPAFMAGVPPDYFSATGQLWGNPVYDWDKMEQTNFKWWIDRFRATLLYVDIVRIDHFRGFEAYWQVPGGETTAMNGEWIKGPDAKFFEALKAAIGSLPVMAEDLGIITPEVELLRDRFEFPGMRILQFAFGGGADNAYLPHNYVSNCVVYPGTHDNDTAIGWWHTASENEKYHVAQYLGYDSPDQVHSINWEFIRLALASVADLAIIPLQDLLDLDGKARMNDPRYNDGQWRWRFTDASLLSPELSDRLLKLTHLYRR
ncbi:4-alpha-glucanotransferase [Thermocoleostomius sinensis]|uniref:4-alpha-glucanotransferase n=1 Tax=Thermocoleostomius sinensis A174 TaxID=2016057 RepID=A0A9E8ZM32_9CYAN|nr:4-alpha-glucanotransferase [Thermocoleostomius sinensis]WAL60986.1 4-alpha-glucanotransferase [Thermocoleostomius sinensis A174]